jgi:anti-sigma regulatory factor (Ser/Thr protein kinase)
METVTLSSAQDKPRLDDALLSFARTHQLPPPAVQAIDLALEEHLTNVFNYGFEPGGHPQVVVRIEQNPSGLTVEISDNGRPFNPLEHPEPDVSLPLEERPIGGLGIHLIRKSVEQLSYRHEAGRNILTMCKRLKPG